MAHRGNAKSSSDHLANREGVIRSKAMADHDDELLPVGRAVRSVVRGGWCLGWRALGGLISFCLAAARSRDRGDPSQHRLLLLLRIVEFFDALLKEPALGFRRGQVEGKPVLVVSLIRAA
jgi:hypothetical protein